MITFLTARHYSHTLKVVLKSPALTAAVRVVPYEWLFTRDVVPGGTYVFTDHERLGHHELAAAARAFRSMVQAGVRALNDPAKVLARGELLHALAAAGINGFTAYRASLGPRPRQFPVFVRSETDHSRFSDTLFASQEDLDRHLRDLVAQGVPLRNLLVVEFSAAPLSPGGLYRKHSVFRVADRFIACSPVTEETWQVKYGRVGLASSERLTEAAREIDENPFADRLRAAFEIGCIDYGRSDFGFVGEKLSVFEINTNPAVNAPGKHDHPDYEGARQRMIDRIADAISAIDSAGPRVRLDWAKPWYRRNKFFAGFSLKKP